MAEFTVDARFLAPPEPMERALEGLDRLENANDVMLLLLHREPFPLYDVLRRNGFEYQTSSTEDGTFQIRVRKVAA